MPLTVNDTVRPGTPLSLLQCPFPLLSRSLQLSLRQVRPGFMLLWSSALPAHELKRTAETSFVPFIVSCFIARFILLFLFSFCPWHVQYSEYRVTPPLGKEGRDGGNQGRWRLFDVKSADDSSLVE